MTGQIYIVICGTKEPYVAERDLADMNRETTIKQLAAGEWGSVDGDRFSVSSIIEVGTDRDCTDEFINAARMLTDSYRSPRLTGEDLNTWRADHARDLMDAG